MDEVDQPGGQARQAARRAATEAGVQVRDLGPDPGELTALAALLDEVWGRDDRVMPLEMLVALAHAGNQVSGAYRDGELVGGTAAFFGRHDATPHLHSHITGVLSDHQGTGVGRALKQHQRDWALQRGITTVRWTFDPLARRNAVFNLIKLGARPVGYIENCYGAMQDERNRGLPSDRMLIAWELGQRRVQAAAEGDFHAPDVDALRRVGATEVLVDDGGQPRTAPLEGGRLLAQIPADIEAIRPRDRQRAEAWVQAARASLGAAMEAGYHVTGITRDGWYVLAARGAVSDLTG